MKINCKVFLIFSVLITCSKVCYANLGVFNKVGTTYIVNGEPYQNYEYIMPSCEYYDLKITNQDQHISNETDSSIVYPANSLYFRFNSIERMLPYNVEQVVGQEGSQCIADKKIYPLTFYIKKVNANSPDIASGIYLLNIRGSDAGKGLTQHLTVEFDVPVVKNIAINQSNTTIQLDESEVFTANTIVTNNSNTTINITANSFWRLYVDTPEIDISGGEYYLKVLSKSNNEIATIADDLPLMSNTSYEIASKSVFNASQTAPDNITIQYYLKTPSDKYPKAQNMDMSIQYRLE